MKKLLRKILLGVTLPQEYLCVSLGEFKDKLKVYIQDKNSETEVDITSHHLFIGYNPLVIAIDKKYFTKNNLSSEQHIVLSFRSTHNREIASLKLKLVREVSSDSMKCMIFEGVYGAHLFNNIMQKKISSLYHNRHKNKQDNTFLSGNLYEQVKIAYSVPRKIYLAVVGSKSLYNIFPTDLSGAIGENNFIMSLRDGGKSNEQISTLEKCLVATMNVEYFNDVYRAGKNHMKELSPENTFEIKLTNEISTFYDLPIPMGTIKYLELQIIESFKIGIHIIYFLRIINSMTLSKSDSVLAHLHRDYCEWRLKNGMESNYLIRK